MEEENEIECNVCGNKYADNYFKNKDNRIKELEKALEEKDKIIDEMAECINDYQICDYEISDEDDRKCIYIADDEKPPCKQCIIEYFEKKEG